MNQYGTEKPIFTSGCRFMLTMPHVRNEALWGGAYSKLFRDGRRKINKDPVAWWREQTRETGTPHHYHCWGW